MDTDILSIGPIPYHVENFLGKVTEAKVGSAVMRFKEPGHAYTFAALEGMVSRWHLRKNLKP